MLQRITSELRHYVRLGLPMLGTLLLNQFMVTADAIVAGQFSELHLAGVGIALGIYTPIFFTVFGAFFILPSLFSQMYGAKEFSKMGVSVVQMLFPALVMAGVGIVLLSLLPALVFGAIGSTPEVAAIAVAYIDVLKWCMIPNAVLLVIRSALEGMGHVRVLTLATFFGLIINIIADLVLVNGWWGFPQLGAVGCGYATVFAYWTMLICVALYGIFNPRARVIGAVVPRPSKFTANPGFRMQVIVLGIPVAVSIGIELAMFSGASLILSPLGKQQIAIHQIALNIAGLAYMLPLSIGLSGTIRIGNLIGAKRTEDARFSVRILIGTACFASLVNMLIIAVFATEISSLYSQDAGTIALAASLLLIAALFQFPDCVQGACIGALRAVNVVKFPMWSFFYIYLGVGIPLGIVLSHYPAFGGPYGAFGMWAAMVISLAGVAGLLAYKVYAEYRAPGPSLEGIRGA